MPVNQMQQRPGSIPGTPDLTKITPVTIQTQPSQAKGYQIPVYASMTLKDGSTADVLVNVIQVTKDQLQSAIDRSQAMVDQAQAQLDAINAYEAAQTGGGEIIKP